MADLQLVPVVSGLNQPEAEAALTGAQLVVGAIVMVTHDSAPLGRVVGSSPTAGELVEPGTVVSLEVSKGSETVVVPEIVGVIQADAESAIRRAGLKVGTVTRVGSAHVPSGSVLAATPQPGSAIPSSATVDLQVSSGPALVEVPNVTGVAQTAAEATLNGVGLVLGAIMSANNPTAAKGSVTNSAPVAGTRVAVGSRVDLEVSSGPAQIAVPDLTGVTRQAAETTLRAAGLLPGAITTEPSSTVPHGGVSSQNPPPGTLASPADRIALVISSGVKAQRSTRIGFTVLGLGILGTILWGMKDVEGGFLTSLADKENARGLITFLIAITTVGIAMMLALSTIVLDDSTENDERFDRGKQVLTILIGVLGTIVGFYFGSADNEQNAQQQRAGQAQTLAIATDSLDAGAAGTAYVSMVQATGGTSPLTWAVEPALPAGLELDQKTGVVSGVPEGASTTELAFTVKDSSTPSASVEKRLTLEIKAGG